MSRKPAFPALVALASATCVLLAACNSDPASRFSKFATGAEARSTGKPGFSDTSALLALADRIAEAGDPAAAIPLYRRAHEARPRDPAPLLGLGRALAAIGQYGDARDAFERAVGRDKTDPVALTAFGNSLVQMDRAQDGLAFLDNALMLDPRLPEALRGKATALDLLGRHDEAVMLYGEALAAAPQDIRSLNNYGLSLVLHGATDDGIRVLEGALQTPSSTGGMAVRQNLALAYLLRGHEDEARRLVAIDFGQSAADSRLRDLYMVAALPPARRLAALVQSGRSVMATAPEGLSAQQVAALRVIGKEPIMVAEITPPATLAAISPAPVSTQPVATITPVTVTTTARMGWTVQLAAYRKADQLTGGWNRFTSQYGDLLAGLSPQHAEINFATDSSGPKGLYYRLTAGPLSSRAAAVSLCNSLQARGAACLVRALPAGGLQLASAT
ncbi:SPOR domain-containing protein [Govanella unica]|uniref:Tetratricopeptide repeat protein n=1 Tax=Govanella unica TaxID=2975056 RepID=A0A9X3TW23_9PROT|nr:SPOR domain-containing protein [Govania unica]MDA5192996.1 tetratricopeptide repeat protein [Govania unica]